MGFLPVLWVTLRRDRRLEWWWLALAFSVSGLADLASYGPHPLVAPWIAATVYPILQVGMIGAVLVSRPEAELLMLALIGAGLLGLWVEGIGPSLLLETVADGAVVGLVWPRRDLGKLRGALLVGFGGGWLAWVGYLFVPGLAMWGVYQGVRVAGLGLFCWASLQTKPVLRVA